MLRIVWKAPCSHWTKLLAKWDSVWIRTYYTWSTRLNCDVKQIHMRVWVECSWRSAVQNSAWKKQGREKKKQCSLSWWRKNWGAKDRKISTKYITTICWSSKACMPSMHLHCTAKLWKTHLRWVTFTVKLLWCQSLKFSSDQPAVQLFQTLMLTKTAGVRIFVQLTFSIIIINHAFSLSSVYSSTSYLVVAVHGSSNLPAALRSCCGDAVAKGEGLVAMVAGRVLKRSLRGGVELQGTLGKKCRSYR